MRKTAVVISSALLLGLLAAGCGDSNNSAPAASTAPAESTAPSAASSAAPSTDAAKYQDGVYYGTVPVDEKTGWQTYAILTVEGGKITKVDWNAFNVNNAGDLKKKVSEDGKYGLVSKGGAQAEWHEQAAKAEAFLIEKQDPAAITFDAEGHTDAISGVSVHVNDLVQAAQAALAAGPAQPGAYKDGGYHVQGEMDANSGWAPTVDLSIANGNIVAAKFSGVDKDGNDKQQFSQDGKYGMKEKNPKAQAEWHEEAIKAQQYYLANQTAAPAFDAEGKTDAISGVTISVGEYWTLAEKALEGAK